MVAGLGSAPGSLLFTKTRSRHGGPVLSVLAITYVAVGADVQRISDGGRICRRECCEAVNIDDVVTGFAPVLGSMPALAPMSASSC